MAVSEEIAGGERRLPAGAAFWVLAAMLACLLAAASAPSPLYVVYQARWHFSAITLTIVFAVYVLALLCTLVVAGSVSDYVGRRPALVAGLLGQAAAMALFALAHGVAWLLAARTMQGIGTGLGTGALGAAILDLQPSERPRHGALVNSVAPLAGMTVGALGSGLLVEYGPAPRQLVFWILVGVYAASIAMVPFLPETVARDAHWRRSLRPSVTVPRASRSAFVAMAPCLIATWALGGLYLSLGPSLVSALLHSRSHFVGALPIVALTAAAGVGTLAARNMKARSAMLAGAVLLIVGVGVALPAIDTGSTALFFVGSAIAGSGFGPAFNGAFRTLTASAPSDQRAGLITAMYVVSYVAFSIPALAAGVAVTQVGLRTTALAYGAGVAVLAAAAVVITVAGRSRVVAGA